MSNATKLEEFSQIEDSLILLFGATYQRKARICLTKFLQDDDEYPIHVLLGKVREEFESDRSISEFFNVSIKDLKGIVFVTDQIEDFKAGPPIKRMMVLNAERIKDLKTLLETTIKENSPDQIILISAIKNAPKVLNRIIDRFPSIRLLNYNEESFLIKFKPFHGPIKLLMETRKKTEQALGKLDIKRKDNPFLKEGVGRNNT